MKTLLVAIIVSMPMLLMGQDRSEIILLHKGWDFVYSDGAVTGKLHELGDVFGQDAESWRLFRQFNRRRRCQRGFNVAAPVICFGSYVFFKMLTGGDIGGDNPQIGLASVTVSAPFFMTGMILGVAKNRKKKQLLHYWNTKYGNVDESTSYWSIGLAPHGYGLVYHF